VGPSPRRRAASARTSWPSARSRGARRGALDHDARGALGGVEVAVLARALGGHQPRHDAGLRVGARRQHLAGLGRERARAAQVAQEREQAGAHRERVGELAPRSRGAQLLGRLRVFGERREQLAETVHRRREVEPVRGALAGARGTRRLAERIPEPAHRGGVIAGVHRDHAEPARRERARRRRRRRVERFERAPERSARRVVPAERQVGVADLHGEGGRGRRIALARVGRGEGIERASGEGREAHPHLDDRGLGGARPGQPLERRDRVRHAPQGAQRGRADQRHRGRAGERGLARGVGGALGAARALERRLRLADELERTRQEQPLGGRERARRERIDRLDQERRREVESTVAGERLPAVVEPGHGAAWLACAQPVAREGERVGAQAAALSRLGGAAVPGGAVALGGGGERRLRGEAVGR
jgi:hypothetical protein